LPADENNRLVSLGRAARALLTVVFGLRMTFSWFGVTLTEQVDDIGEFVAAFAAAGACA